MEVGCQKSGRSPGFLGGAAAVEAVSISAELDDESFHTCRSSSSSARAASETVVITTTGIKRRRKTMMAAAAAAVAGGTSCCCCMLPPLLLLIELLLHRLVRSLRGGGATTTGFGAHMQGRRRSTGRCAAASRPRQSVQEVATGGSRVGA